MPGFALSASKVTASTKNVRINVGTVSSVKKPIGTMKPVNTAGFVPTAKKRTAWTKFVRKGIVTVRPVKRFWEKMTPVRISGRAVPVKRTMPLQLRVLRNIGIARNANGITLRTNIASTVGIVPNAKISSTKKKAVTAAGDCVFSATKFSKKRKTARISGIAIRTIPTTRRILSAGILTAGIAPNTKSF
jgi:hypothetical protein